MRGQSVRAFSVDSNYYKDSRRRSRASRKGKLPAHILDYREDEGTDLIPHCSFCHVDFKNIYQWHAHLITFLHKCPLPSLEELKNRNEEAIIVCRVCRQDIILSTIKDHRCFVTEVSRVEAVVNQLNSSFCPIVCILCKDIKPFKSKGLLQVHLLTKHSPTRHPWRCNLCNSQFRSVSVNVHEAHAEDIHGPELNLIYWKMQGEQSKIKSKPQNFYTCGLSHFSILTDQKLKGCPEDLSDIFHFTLHTLCSHGILSHIPPHDDNDSSLERTNSNEIEHLDCKYCGRFFESLAHFNDHVHYQHLNEFMIRKDFILRKEMMIKKVFLSLTCLICIEVFKSTSALKVHLFVNHATEEVGYCGMCGEDLIHFDEIDKKNSVDKIHWKTIKYHESLHMQQLNNYKETGIFNSSLKPTPDIYASDEQFIKEVIARKKIVKGPLFTDEQLTFLKRLGKKNYENQVIIEMNN